MCALLKDDSFSFDFPEREKAPFLTINNLLIEKKRQGNRALHEWQSQTYKTFITSWPGY